MRRVYLDHAATTPLDPGVIKAMEPFLGLDFGNPGGLYEEGRRAKEAVDSARKTIATLIGAREDEIIFTSGGTESDNLAIFGSTESYLTSSVDHVGHPHIITTKFEHHAVLHPCEELAKRGFEVTYLEVGKEGIVDPKEVQTALRPETVLVSIMYANNEIGTIQPIAEIGRVIKNFKLQTKNNKLVFHTDACQAAGYLGLNVNELSVDLMTINGPKIYGPKGIGVLYKRAGIKIKPRILGGGQEFRMRSGTENVPYIIGMAKALEIAQADSEAESKRLSELRDYFISEIVKRVPKVVLNGHAKKRLPNNVNISILDIEGEALVLYLDAAGISFSTGSACTSESLDPSHVILALGKPYEFAHSSMRFTLGRRTSKSDLDYVLEKLPATVEWLRRISPLTLKVDAKEMSHPEAFAGEGLRVKAKSKSYK